MIFPEGTLCGWWEVKMQTLTNLLLTSGSISVMYIWCNSSVLLLLLDYSGSQEGSDSEVWHKTFLESYTIDRYTHAETCKHTVQFSSSYYLRTWKSPWCALCSVSQRFPQCHLWSSSNDRPIEDDSFSSFQGRSHTHACMPPPPNTHRCTHTHTQMNTCTNINTTLISQKASFSVHLNNNDNIPKVKKTSFMLGILGGFFFTAP